MGSGGPLAEGGRAGTSYLVRVDGRPSLLIDAGPGSFLNMAKSGAQPSELAAVALTHLHVDHSGNVPAMLNADAFRPRARALVMIGPAAAGIHAGTDAFVRALFGRGNGAWRLLGALVGEPVGGDADRPALAIREIDASDVDGAPASLLALADGISLTAIPVHHDGVPSLGYRVDARGGSILVTGDQSFLATGFAARTAGSKPDLMVAHHVIPEGPGQPLGLHRSPSSIGELAANVAPRRLLLSHHMARSLDRLDEGLAAIRQHYTGPVDVAEDGDCIVVRP